MPENRARNIVGLGAFLALCFGVSAVGGMATSTSVSTWFQTLNKPAFNPPDWVFAPVWTILYVLIAVAGWRVWKSVGLTRAKIPFAVYGVQLVLNMSWSLLFFGAREIVWAFVDILFLLASIIATWWLFRPIDSLAALMLVPYGAWVAFAAVLNASIVILNP